MNVCHMDEIIEKFSISVILKDMALRHEWIFLVFMGRFRPLIEINSG